MTLKQLCTCVCAGQVQQRMQRLKEKLFRDVSSVLEPSRQPALGRWQEAWHRAARFLNRRPGHSQAHQQDLQNRLYELHAAISSSIEAEVCCVATISRPCCPRVCCCILTVPQKAKCVACCGKPACGQAARLSCNASVCKR